MDEVLRVILLVALAAAALTTAALTLNWWMEPERRLRRALLKSLGRPPEVEAMAPAEGKAAGLDFDSGQVAVLWDRGAHGLVYGFDEVEGGEIIVDGQAAGPQTACRCARWPEFELALWNALAPAHTGTPSEALRLGRRWLSHLEALLK